MSMISYYSVIVLFLLGFTPLCLVRGQYYPCGQVKCECYVGSSEGQADCQKRNLTSVPLFYKEEVLGIDILNLDRNYLRTVERASFDKTVFTSLSLVYLRHNPYLDCQSVRDNIPKRIRVISDCGYTTLTHISLPETNISMTTERIPLRMAASTHTVLYGLLGLGIFVIIIVLAILSVYLARKLRRGNLQGSEMELYSYVSPVYRETTESNV